MSERPVFGSEVVETSGGGEPHRTVIGLPQIPDGREPEPAAPVFADLPDASLGQTPVGAIGVVPEVLKAASGPVEDIESVVDGHPEGTRTNRTAEVDFVLVFVKTRTK